MRAVALAVLVLTAALAGCAHEDAVPTSIEAPSVLPGGLLLTYEVDQGGETIEATFVVRRVGQGNVDLLPERVPVAGFESPFLRLGAQLTPRDPAWAGLLQFPLRDGDAYDGRAGGADVSVAVSALEGDAYAWGSSDAMVVAATDAAGIERARVHVLAEPPVLGRIDVDTPDGTDETWTLVRWDLDPLWGDVPRWTIGQWWSYRARTQDIRANLTLVYNANDTGEGGSPLYQLNAVDVADRLAALPFQRLRMQDLASQSGLFNNMLSVQYSWPLSDGATWRGSTHAGERDHAYEARARLARDVPLPNGTYSTGYFIEASLSDGTVFARWNYVPVVGTFTAIQVFDAVDGSVRLNWTLTGFGDGFRGTIEFPERRVFFRQPLTSGPLEFEDNFAISGDLLSVETNGIAGRQERASPNSTIEVVGPSGQRPLSRNASDFAASRQVSLVEAFQPEAGTWMVRANVTEGTSFFLDVVGIWAREVEVDYSGLGTDRR